MSPELRDILKASVPQTTRTPDIGILWREAQARLKHRRLLGSISVAFFIIAGAVAASALLPSTPDAVVTQKSAGQDNGVPYADPSATPSGGNAECSGPTTNFSEYASRIYPSAETAAKKYLEASSDYDSDSGNWEKSTHPNEASVLLYTLERDDQLLARISLTQVDGGWMVEGGQFC